MISNILHTNLKRKCSCTSAALGNCPEQHFFHYLPSATFLSFCRSPITLAQILQPLCFHNLCLHLHDQCLQLLFTILAGMGVDIACVFLAVGLFGGVAPLEEVVVDLTDAAGTGSALTAHVGLEVGHSRLFCLGRCSFLSRL